MALAAEWQAQGPERLRQLARIARAWRDTWQRCDLDASGGDAFALLGFAAADDAPRVPSAAVWPNALLWVPEVGVCQQEGITTLTFSTALPREPASLLARWRDWLTWLTPLFTAPETARAVSAHCAPTPLTDAQALPDAPAWQALVRAALARIDAGALAKVVLARRLDIRGARAFDLDRLLATLGEDFPSCRVIHIRRGEHSFVAATPERLLCLRGRTVEIDALAGTAPRAIAAADDALLRAALLGSEKNLREHRLVVEAIRAAVAPCCTAPPHAPATPRLLHLRNAHHLWSPLRAEVQAGIDVFDLAERLHPTPATNGQPRDAARDWLRAAEPFARGWYTGAAGIVAPELSGTLWVLLRCAQIHGDRAELYAGSGIVAGSDPREEWDETEAKLGAMRAALGRA